MKVFDVALKELYPTKGGSLRCMVAQELYDPWQPEAETWRRPAVIVVPGGAYSIVSKREGLPVAAEFFAKGYQTFVLTYLCQPQGVAYPEQLIELASAVDYVKKHADELRVNPEEVFVVGFSAGGHLTCNLAVEHESVSQKAGVELDCKPTAVGLCYPVITEKAGYVGTHKNLLDGYTATAKKELLKTLNLNEAVTDSTSPAFIWTTAGDNVVPSENSLLFAYELAKRKIPYELHVYPQGYHGLSTGTREANVPPYAGEYERVTQWTENCIKFFRSFCKEPF